MLTFWIIYLLGSLLNWYIITFYIVEEFTFFPHVEREGTALLSLMVIGLQLASMGLSWPLTICLLWAIFANNKEQIRNWILKQYLNIRLTLKYWWFLIVNIPL